MYTSSIEGKEDEVPKIVQLKLRESRRSQPHSIHITRISYDKIACWQLSYTQYP